jgi:hypothetical protein
MNWLNKNMVVDDLLNQLRKHYPELKFIEGEQFCWSPKTQEVIYKVGSENDEAIWSLLHETSHALLGHTTFHSDIELLRLEVAAWDKANQLAVNYKVQIDEEHVQDCLDTYRDWLYSRSICPECNAKSLQQGDFVHYRCFNCHKIWRVSGNRFGRAYRITKRIPAEAEILFT